mmetsp:Transcript_99895/g.258128  ORF Transcript_99895/g.258128 Transcript_99895/m.258128 type:complete len:550 (-) Transcript_99895:210-1859(-)
MQEDLRQSVIVAGALDDPLAQLHALCPRLLLPHGPLLLQPLGLHGLHLGRVLVGAHPGAPLLRVVLLACRLCLLLRLRQIRRELLLGLLRRLCCRPLKLSNVQPEHQQDALQLVIAQELCPEIDTEGVRLGHEVAGVSLIFELLDLLGRGDTVLQMLQLHRLLLVHLLAPGLQHALEHAWQLLANQPAHGHRIPALAIPQHVPRQQGLHLLLCVFPLATVHDIRQGVQVLLHSAVFLELDNRVQANDVVILRVYRRLLGVFAQATLRLGHQGFMDALDLQLQLCRACGFLCAREESPDLFRLHHPLAQHKGLLRAGAERAVQAHRPLGDAVILLQMPEHPLPEPTAPHAKPQRELQDRVLRFAVTHLPIEMGRVHWPLSQLHDGTLGQLLKRVSHLLQQQHHHVAVVPEHREAQRREAVDHAVRDAPAQAGRLLILDGLVGTEAVNDARDSVQRATSHREVQCAPHERAAPQQQLADLRVVRCGSQLKTGDPASGDSILATSLHAGGDGVQGQARHEGGEVRIHHGLPEYAIKAGQQDALAPRLACCVE